MKRRRIIIFLPTSWSSLYVLSIINSWTLIEGYDNKPAISCNIERWSKLTVTCLSPPALRKQSESQAIQYPPLIHSAAARSLTCGECGDLNPMSFEDLPLSRLGSLMLHGTWLLVACSNLHLPKVVYQGPTETKDMGDEMGNDQSGTYEHLIFGRPSAYSVCLLVL